MNRVDRAARERPGLYPFGTEPEGNPWKLTAAKERKAPFEVRLRSIWKYIVRRALRFAAVLTERERSNLDAEDLASEITAALLEKDHKWEPDRARYVTFAENIIANVLSAKREQARVVAAPANAAGRLRRYQERHAAGTLSPEATRTMHAIEAALGEVEAVAADADPTFGSERDRQGPSSLHLTKQTNAEINEAIRELQDPRQALILGKTFGLYGCDEQTTREIADSIGGSAQEVRSIQARAKTALRKRIEKLRKEKT